MQTDQVIPSLAHFSFSAPDDLQNPDRIRSLLKDIREARQAKSCDGLVKLDHNELLVRSNGYICVWSNAKRIIQLENLCAMEINEIRPFFVRGMNVLTQLTREPTSNQMDET